MSKRFLSLIMSLALACVIMAGLTVTASAEDDSAKGEVGNLQNYISVSSIQEFYHVAGEGGKIEDTNIRITEDMTIDRIIPVKSAKIYVDEGVTLTMNGAFCISGNCVFGGKGTIKVGPKAVENATWYSLITSLSGGSVTIEGLTLDGGAVWTGTVDQKLGRGTENTGIKLSTEYSLVSSYGGKVYISDAVLQNAEVAYPANCRLTAAVMLNSAEAYLDKVTIRNIQKDLDAGAGICLTNGAYVYVKDSEMYGIDNAGNSSYLGGAIGVTYPDAGTGTGDDNTIIIDGSTKIHNNISKFAGAAIGVRYPSDKVYIYDGEIFSNYTVNGKGAVGVEGNDTGSLYMYGGSIHDNTGGGIKFRDIHFSGTASVKNNNQDIVDVNKVYIDGKLSETFDVTFTPSVIKNGVVASAGENYTIQNDDLKKITIEGYNLAIANNSIVVGRTVTFKNGDADEGYKQIVSTGAAAVLNKNTFENSDTSKNFLGWASEDDKNTVIYPDGAEIKTDSDVTLYAVWGDKKAWQPGELNTLTFTYDGSVKSYKLGDFDISYRKGDENVESPKNAGSYDVIITREEDDAHTAYAATLYGGLVISKAPLNVTVDTPQAIHVGDTVPADFTYKVDGLVNREEADAVLTTKPTITTETDGTASGEYPVTAAGAAAENYSITYVPAILTVTDHEHAENDSGQVVEAATCTTDGIISYNCTAEGCKAGTFTVSTPKLGHDYGDYCITGISEPDVNGKFVITESAVCRRDDAHGAATRTDVHYTGGSGGIYEDNDRCTKWICGYCGLSYKKIKGQGEDRPVYEKYEIICNPTAVWTGSAVTLDVSVIKNGTEMNPESYIVEYDNNTEVGTAHITVKDASDQSVIGNTSFDIVDSYIITISGNRYRYTGSPIEPEVSVEKNGIMMNSEEYTLEYSNNINKGTASVSVKVGGNVVGTVNFYIVSGNSGGKDTADIGTIDSKDETADASAASPSANSGAAAAVKADPAVNLISRKGTAVSGKDFTEPAVLTIPVDTRGVKDINNLTIAKFNGETGKIEIVGGSYNSDEKAVKGYITEPGDYFVVEKDNLTTITLQIGNYEATVNNSKKDMDSAPVISQDRTMVPIRFVAEAFGAKVDWEDATRTVTIETEGKVLTLVIGQELEGFDAVPVISNDRTMVPIRYISEQLNANVIWVPSTSTVSIVK